MSYNHLNSNLCNTTEIILENYKAMRAEQKYLSSPPLQTDTKKDTLEKNSRTTKIAGDGSDDGKISFKEKVKNFGKGLTAPVRNMFSSPKNIAITVASAAAGIGLIALTSGAIAPVMVTAGLIGGGIQIGKGINRQANAQTDEEAKQAWQEIGSGTFTTGVSAVSAKPALKASGVSNTKDMSTFTAILKCIKDTPKNIVKSGSRLAGKFSAAAESISQTLNAADTYSASSNSVESVDVEILGKSTSKPSNNTPKNFIDADFTEIVEETEFTEVPQKYTNTNKPLELNAKHEIPKLSGKKKLFQLKEGSKVLLLEAHNSDIQQKPSIGQKLINLLKVFGFFKPNDSAPPV